MRADLPFSCDCGRVRGVLRDASPADGARLTCYCDDCQAFAFYLNREDDLLDPWGGSEIFQILPARFEINSGADDIAVVEVTGRGVMRWYAACCRTPLANTARSARLPFLGTLVHIYDASVREAAIGPSKGYVFEKDAWSPPQAGAAKHPLAIMGRNLIRVFAARLTGSWKINPFFDTTSDRPIADPHRLTADERAQIDARIAARRSAA